jgi:hypothetical protein
MDKTICINVRWEKINETREELTLLTHKCPPIKLAVVMRGCGDDKYFWGIVDVSDGDGDRRKFEEYEGTSMEEVKTKIEISVFGKPATFSKLPSLTHQPLEVVDMTPDESLPLRILQAYRTNCDCRWEADPPSKLVDLMNEANDKRAEILDKAIERLKSPVIKKYKGKLKPMPVESPWAEGEE